MIEGRSAEGHNPEFRGGAMASAPQDLLTLADFTYNKKFRR